MWRSLAKFPFATTFFCQVSHKVSFLAGFSNYFCFSYGLLTDKSADISHCLPQSLLIFDKSNTQ